MISHNKTITHNDFNSFPMREIYHKNPSKRINGQKPTLFDEPVDKNHFPDLRL